MEAVLRLGELAHPLIKLLAYKSLVKAIASVGADKRFSYPLLETDMGSMGPLFHSFACAFADTASYKLRELINREDYGFQMGLQRAYQSALASTLAVLEERSLQEHRDAAPATIAAFFEYLKVDYGQQEQLGFTDWDKVIDAVVYQLGDIFEKVSEAIQLDPALPEAEVLCSFIGGFPGEMERAFLGQLVNPEHEGANLLFMLYLVESYLQDGLSIQKVVLWEASRLLDKILALPTVGQFHREEAQRLLESLREELNSRMHGSDGASQVSASKASEASPPLPLYLPGDGMGSEAPGLFRWQETAPSFVGQASELKELHEFVRIEDRAFHWGAIVGPTGTGKSRLAVEACQQVRKLGFTAGFLRAEHLGLLAGYHPQNPTLVVIDGIATVYEKVIEVIEHLYERRHTNPLARNLRLLLLDRSIYDSWWEYFSANPQVSQSSFRKGYHLRTDHSFSGMDDKGRWQIIREVYQERRKGDIPYSSKEVLKELDRLDSNRTPQFAVLVGLMLADSHYRNLVRMDRGQVLLGFIDRKKREYRQALDTYGKETIGDYERLLVLATITRDLPEATVKEVCEEGSGARLPEKPDRGVYAQLSACRLDAERGEYVWEGLPVGIVGEFYVLHRIGLWVQESGGQNEGKETTERLIQMAWEVRPAETRAFVKNIVKDFPELANSPAYQLLLYTAPPAHSARQVWTERARLLSHLMSVIYSEDELPVFARYHEVLKRETNTVTEEAAKELLFLWQARISSYLIHYFLFYDNEVQAEKYYQQTAALLDRFGKPDFAYCQAQAELSYVAYSIKKNQPQWTERYYGRIRDLQSAYRDSDVAWVQAKAARRLVEYFTGAENHTAARQYYEQIEALQEEFPDVAIALVQAKAAHHLAMLYTFGKKKEQSRHYHGQITALNEKYQDYELAREEHQLIRELIRHARRDDANEEENPEGYRMYYRRMFDLEKLIKTF